MMARERSLWQEIEYHAFLVTDSNGALHFFCPIWYHIPNFFIRVIIALCFLPK